MTLLAIFKRYKLRISLTLLFVLMEAAAMLFLPLLIGMAIDGLINGDNSGLWKLGALGFGVLVSGSLRRFYDTRVYSSIYTDLSTETIEGQKSASTSAINARITMLRELVEFLENQLPELITSLASLIGAIGILLFLDFEIFLGCLVIMLLIIIVFAVTGKFTTKLNYHYNNAAEEQVDVIKNRHQKPVRGFMKRLMGWNIKLSDLETVIFGVIWLGMIVLMLFSVIQAVGTGIDIKAGAVMATVMYVMQFAEGAGMLPLYFQQFLRLGEISSRLKSD